MSDIFKAVSEVVGDEVPPPTPTLTVWRFDITPKCLDPKNDDHSACVEISVELPIGARFLDMGQTPSGIQSWWLVDPSAPKAPCRLRFYETGEPVPASAIFLATSKQDGGPFKVYVDHLFMLPES